MRVFNEKNNSNSSYRNSTPSCSYCGDVDHRVTSCPHVSSDWAMFQSFSIPCSDPDHWTNKPKAAAQGQNSWSGQANTAHWFKNPSGWSKWYAQCEKAFEKYQRAQQREQAKTSGKRKTTRSCGFCGDHAHTRRNCTEMQRVRTMALKANANWRREFFDKFVTQLGLSEGALVQIHKPKGYANNQFEVLTGLVTSVNWDELHCGTDRNFKNPSSTNRWNADLDRSLQQTVQITVHAGGRDIKVNIDKSHLYGIVSYENGSWEYNLKTVLSPSETLKGQEWIDQGHEEAVDFVVKKRSYQKLNEQGYIGLVDKWSKKVSQTI